MLLFKHFAILYYRLARELFTHARINLIYILICSKKARTEASDFIESKHKNNAKSINLKKLDETGLKTNNSSNSRKTSPTSKRGLPNLFIQVLTILLPQTMRTATLVKVPDPSATPRRQHLSPRIFHQLLQTRPKFTRIPGNSRFPLKKLLNQSKTLFPRKKRSLKCLKHLL